ncbi:hypothetical protein D9598_16525 [Roseomonas sp. KE0001]|nr:hypothetical protein [Roseomonas sp. KE0001]
MIDLLDAYDAPMADMEPDWDHEADADAERSLQPLPLEPQPFPGGKGPHSERTHLGCGKGVHSEHSLLVLAERVVQNRSGSKPFRAAPAHKPWRPGFLRRSLAYIANGDLPPVLAFVWPAREPWIPPPPPVKRRPAAKRTLAHPGTRAGNVPENQRQSAVSSQRADTALPIVLERSEHVAEWIRLTEEKVKLAQVAPVSERGRVEGRGNEGGIRSAARELGVDRDAARRAAKVAGLSDRAKEIHEALHPETRHGGDRKSSGKLCHLNSFTDDTALRASLAACCIIFAACAGWAVTL